MRLAARVPLLLVVAFRLWGQGDAQASLPETGTAGIARAAGVPAGSKTAERSAGETGILPTGEPVRPAPGGGSAVSVLPDSGSGVDWGRLFSSSARFLAVQHGFRLVTEPGTRGGLKGSFAGNYATAVSNLHGWADGDEFYVNYVGHPMAGSVAGFLWVQNDRSYRRAEFGRNRLYWRSRLRAAAFAWAYSEQFEIGPVSEASIGAIQSVFPQQGFVDHVVTPTIGLGWMIGEDVLDRFLIRRIEASTSNRYIRLLARSALNPSRSFANVLQGNAPWQRETRSGILSYAPRPADRRPAPWPDGLKPAPVGGDVAGAAPFEFETTFYTERFLGDGRVDCLGGGGTAAVRITPAWQVVFDARGCKMIGLEEDLSGDSLTYMAGPRWRTSTFGRWSASVQFLIGGNKVTGERMFQQTKKLLDAAAAASPRRQPPNHSDYTKEMASNGLAVRGGGGVECKLNSALTLRIAELEYQRSWTEPIFGMSFSDSVRFSSGLVLRMGTW